MGFFYGLHEYVATVDVIGSGAEAGAGGAPLC